MHQSYACPPTSRSQSEAICRQPSSRTAPVDNRFGTTQSAERRIDAALVDLDFEGPIERRVKLGFTAAILADESSRLDLVVCGSRGYGLVRQVLLGGVSTRLVRMAVCPVVVTPRSALDA